MTDGQHGLPSAVCVLSVYCLLCKPRRLSCMPDVPLPVEPSNTVSILSHGRNSHITQLYAPSSCQQQTSSI